MSIHIRHGDTHRIDLKTRMPFKYGIATMTECPHVFVRLHVEVDGKLSVGIAADHLPPKWFRKDPNQPIDEEIAEMARVIAHAVGVAIGMRAPSPFRLWQQLYEVQGAWGRQELLPPLLTHFGTSLVERAMIDAFCRASNRPFSQLVNTNALGIQLGDIHARLKGEEPADFLDADPIKRIIPRHTVGLADPLTDDEVIPDERQGDGLPQSLVSCIQTYGLQQFKVKVSGHIDRDRERLGRIAGVLERHGPPTLLFTLDGNEQFRSAAEFRSYWEQLEGTPELATLLERLYFVEQPLHRDVALESGAALNDWRGRPAIIIDESDAELASLPKALALGYNGTSHKNCKGVFKGLANACLLAHLRRQGQPVVSSGEDLANIGPVALLQDLAVCATLGIVSVERNGHHYFRGLSMFPTQVQEQILRAHGDLYEPSRDGWPTLAIEGGTLKLDSLLAAPFGIEPLIDVEQFNKLE